MKKTLSQLKKRLAWEIRALRARKERNEKVINAYGNYPTTQPMIAENVAISARLEKLELLHLARKMQESPGDFRGKRFTGDTAEKIKKLTNGGFYGSVRQLRLQLAI
jgi:hypothetical protein